jgi:hypothetical protein
MVSEHRHCRDTLDFLPLSLIFLKTCLRTDPLMLAVLLNPFNRGNGRLELGHLFLSKYWNNKSIIHQCNYLVLRTVFLFKINESVLNKTLHKYSLACFTVTTRLTATEYLCHHGYVTRVVITMWSFPYWWLITMLTE